MISFCHESYQTNFVIEYMMKKILKSVPFFYIKFKDKLLLEKLYIYIYIYINLYI